MVDSSNHSVGVEEHCLFLTSAAGITFGNHFAVDAVAVDFEDPAAAMAFAIVGQCSPALAAFAADSAASVGFECSPDCFEAIG